MDLHLDAMNVLKVIINIVKPIIHIFMQDNAKCVLKQILIVLNAHLTVLMKNQIILNPFAILNAPNVPMVSILIQRTNVKHVTQHVKHAMEPNLTNVIHAMKDHTNQEANALNVQMVSTMIKNKSHAKNAHQNIAKNAQVHYNAAHAWMDMVFHHQQDMNV